MSGLDNMARVISELQGKSLAVGFMSNAKYPDGTQVALVAVNNEYGNAKQIARPFMRRMVAKEKGTWSGKLFRLLGSNNYDADAVTESLEVLGEDLKGALQESINSLVSPPLMPSTVARKGFSKPLIDTSHMINSVTYEVRND